MPIPDFVRDLRRRVGHAELWMPGVTAVVLRGGAPTPGATDERELLLVRRADTREWSPVTGIVDPGEEPAVAARREVLEETGVEVHVDRLAWVQALPTITHVNGDVATYLDHTFGCRWVAGEPHVADDESLEACWRPVADLPPLGASLRARVAQVLADDPVTRFTR